MDRKLPPEGRPVRKRNPRRNSTAQPESSHDQPLDVNPYNFFDVSAEANWDYHSAPGPSFHHDIPQPGPSRPHEPPPYPHLPPVSSFPSYASQMHPTHGYLPPEIPMQDFLWHPPAPQFSDPYIPQHQHQQQRPLYEPDSTNHFPYVPEQVPERPVLPARSASSEHTLHSYALPFSPPPPPSSTSATTPNSPEGAESEPESSHDKRRRNTIASARFRIKKKQKALNLERTVSDLTSRATELEREVADLRRENGWLKEIVMLKGATLPRINPSLNASLRRPSSSGQPLPDPDDNESEDDTDSDADTSRKGKGKEKDAKKKKKDSR